MAASLTATPIPSEARTSLLLDWTGTNYATNPSMRTASGTADLRTNTATNPEVGTSLSPGWTQNHNGQGTTTLTRETGGALAGVGDTFARQTWNTVTGTAIGSTGLFASSASNADTMPVTGSALWTFSAYARSSHLDRTAALVVTFHDSAGAQIGGTSTGSALLIGGTDWVRLSLVAVSTPAGAVRAAVRVYSQGGTMWVPGDTFDVTGVLAENATALLPYFDGATANDPDGTTTVWSGTAHASTSVQRLPSLQTVGPLSPYTPNNTFGGRVFTEGEYRLRVTNRHIQPAGSLHSFSYVTNMPAVAGDSFAARWQMRQVGGAAALTMGVRLGSYNSGGTNVSLSPTVNVSLPNDGTWVDAVIPPWVMPANTATVRCMVYTGQTVPAGTVIEMRRVTVEKTTTGTTGYFDGSMTGYQWTGTADASSSTAIVPTTATINRVNLADGSISPVRNAEPATLIAGQWVGADYEAPLDATFYYRATSPDTPLEVLSAQLVLDAGGLSWLKHPGKPALNESVRVETAPNVSRPITQGVFDVLGRTTPVAVSMRRSALRGDLSVLTFDDSETSALLLLLDDGTPLLLQTPAGYGLGNVYIAVGDLNEERTTGVGWEQSRRWTLPFVVVDRPTGAALATGTAWSDLLAAYPSWDAARTAEGTWAGALLGIG